MYSCRFYKNTSFVAGFVLYVLVSGVTDLDTRLSRLEAQDNTATTSTMLTATPLAAWGVANRAVVAVRLQNTASRRIVLDPRALQGQFVAATFQHRWLGPVGTPEDTTTAYIVTGTRPESAFIAEPSSMRKAVHTAKKGVNHAD
ncbi:TPA: DUF3438 family protein [Salmonella enterica subsp. enterica serovar Newport]